MDNTTSELSLTFSSIYVKMGMVFLCVRQLCPVVSLGIMHFLICCILLPSTEETWGASLDHASVLQCLGARPTRCSF